jgi:type I restriction enzyme R subunit
VARLTEQETRSRFITPAITSAGWNIHTQVREDFDVTKGRIIVRGSVHTRAAPKRADYLLFHKPNIPLAVVEAKDTSHTPGSGMQQALAYARMFDVPFAFSTNGRAFLFHDGTQSGAEPIERELPMNGFPSPSDLWRRYSEWKAFSVDQETLVSEDYYNHVPAKPARYYQTVAVNRTLEAIGRGQKRILLVMATGTGKTYTAFQIIWRLWKARTARRILFLADRNILVDQALINDFKPFGSAITKISGRTIDKAYEIYVSLYQAVTGTDEAQDVYKEFSPEFFDLIVVDECHRGSAAEDAAWRDILNYFHSAVHIGMTATPKETKDVSNIAYFGEPVYLYSLRQGIDDGFLAPFRVVRVDIDKDLSGWRPERGRRDKYGTLIEDRIYEQEDYDRVLVLEQRTALVARKVSQLLAASDRFAKTIVFCEDIEHAERMRQALSNANTDLAAIDDRYIVRITGDSQWGKDQLDDFADPESRYPVIATTSKLLSTGVDIQTCKWIVLDQNITSLAEFKQIIGRGTRVREDYDKYYFTIVDFRKATEMFADPDFDGQPISILETEIGEEPGEPGPDGGEEPGDEGPGFVDEDEFDEIERTKYYIADVPVWVIGERVQYFSQDGTLITESLKDYTRRAVAGEFESLDDFLRRWRSSERKSTIIDELEQHGVLFDALAAEFGRDYDAFDLICHVVFDQPALSRRRRADRARRSVDMTTYSETARQVLDALLEKYADEGIEDIEDVQVIRLPPISRLGTAVELLNELGGRDGFRSAVRLITDALYRNGQPASA